MTGSSTNNNTSTTRRASANNNNNAGVNALLVASGVSTTTGTEAVSSSTNNNNNISTSTSAAAHAPRAQGSKAVRSKGSKNFSNDELNSLLELIEKVLPTGNDFWELVAKLHKERFGVMNQNAALIKIFLQACQCKTQYWKSFHFQCYIEGKANQGGYQS